MDILKRSIAPITETAWAEIDEQAKDILETRLSARKVIDVSEPKGWDYSSVPMGRLEVRDNYTQKGVRFGIRKSRPLVETRINFTLDVWELDDVVRGAQDIDLSPLEDAVMKAADFEEQAIYYGLEEGEMEGLFGESEESISISEDPRSIVEATAEGVSALGNSGIEGPYALVLTSDSWRKVQSQTQGYPLEKQLEDLLEGPVLSSANIDNPFLISTRGGDAELILGNDFSIGYEDHSNQEVTLFVTESFTSRVIEPAAIITLEQ